VKSIATRSIGRIGFVLFTSVMVVGAMIAVPASADTSPGSISGTVTLSAGGVDVNGCVNAYPTSPGSGNSTRTASDGTYTIAGLSPGSYHISADPTCGGSSAPTYARQTLTSVTVMAGLTTTGEDFDLVPGGSISGTVTLSGGGVDAGACVNDSLTGGGYGSGTRSASDGTYTLPGLVPGTYTISADPTCGGSTASNYVTQYLTSVTVSAGATTTGENFNLVEGGSISGIVTLASGGPAAGVCVNANPPGGGFGGRATSASDGTYTISGLNPGSYNVTADPTCGGTTSSSYASQTLTSVTVTAGADLASQNFSLFEGGTISGTVNVPGGGAVAGVCVYANPLFGGFGGNAVSRSDGTYTISGLVPGSYNLSVDPGCNASTSSYASQTLFSVSVSAGTTTGENFALVQGGSISGTVTLVTGGAAAGVCVYAYPPGGGSGNGANTASDGTYTISGLAPGSYNVEINPNCNGTTSSYTSSALSGVTVSAGLTTGGENFALVQGGSISGTVTLASGAAASGVCVNANPLGGGPGSGATTGSNGTYTIAGLVPGTYNLFVSPSCNGSLSSYISQNSSGVTVSAGLTTGGENFALVQGGSISGTVTLASGGAASGVCVNAYSPSGGNGNSTTTASDGTYTISGLAPGSYNLLADPTCYGSTSSNYAAQTLTGVNVSTGVTMGNENFTLLQGGSIAGTVNFTSGGAAAGVCVSAYSPGNGSGSSAITAANGTYTISGLAPGSYNVSVDSSCYGSATNYVSPILSGVNVTAGQTASSENFAIVNGGSISGVVILASGGAVAGACVDAYLPGSQFGYGATTASDGTYTIAGLVPGTYNLSVSPGCNGSATNYVSQTLSGVNVTAGQTASDENFALVQGGSVSGTVTLASGGPAAGVCVDVGSSDGGTGFGYATTAGDGSYTISGLAPDSYYVSVAPSCNSSLASYVSQFLPSVSVGGGTTTENFALVQGGSISGTVTVASGGVDAGACVTTSSSDGGTGYGSATTASDGTYTISGLSPGAYAVTVDPTCYGSVSSDLASQTLLGVSVTVETTTEGENFALVQGGSISGTVTVASGGVDAGACVQASSSDGGTGYGYATTASDGTYTISGLAPGAYAVTVDPTCYGSVSSDLASQTLSGVSVSGGATTFGQNFSLAQAGSISGTVTFASGGAAPGVCIDTYSTGGGSVSGTTTASDGTYTFSGLAPGTYDVVADPTCGGSTSSNYEIQFLLGVSVTAGSATGNENFALVLPPGPPTIGAATGANASATVNWSAGSIGGGPVTGYTVTAYDTTTQTAIIDACPSSDLSTLTTCLVTGLNNGDTYTFSVAAISGANTGDFSGSSNDVTPSAPIDVVTFTSPPANALTTDSVTLAAAGSSGDSGVITFSSTTTGVCGVDSGSGALTFTGAAGLCTVSATQGADAVDGYAPTSADTSISVTQPTLYVVPDSHFVTYNGTDSSYTFVLWTGPGATGSAINPASLVGYSAPVCASNYDTAGYTNAATYAGDVTCTGGSSTFYNFDTSATSNLTINPASQAPLSLAVTSATYNGHAYTLTLGTTGGSGTGLVTYGAVSNGTAKGCSLSNGVLTASSAGTCYVTATKAADGNYLVATSAATTPIVTFTPATETVIFNANGGSGPMPKETESYNVATALTSNTFTRNGYTFGGWNTLANGTGVPYGDGATYPFTASVTLYAQWIADVTVTFKANGGSGSMPKETESYPFATSALTTNAFTRHGYTFSGWNTLADGTGVLYGDGAPYPFTTSVTLYAQWIADVTVTFDASGGSGSMPKETESYPFATSALTTNTFTRHGFTFSGWNTLANGTGTAYGDGAPYPFTTSITLYAQWIADVTVSFNANGGSGSVPKETESYNVASALTSNAFTRRGYTFGGWNTAANGSGTTYTNGAIYPFTSSVTLYAQWVA
jgi:uncharacterized repeat protein (TIGR02543 family)